jgi:hypothetical protein
MPGLTIKDSGKPAALVFINYRIQFQSRPVSGAAKPFSEKACVRCFSGDTLFESLNIQLQRRLSNLGIAIWIYSL